MPSPVPSAVGAPFAPLGEENRALTVRLLDGRTISLGPDAPDRLIAAIMRTQRNHASRTQLLAAGIDRRAIDRRVANGELTRRHAGVYRAGLAAPVELEDETVALLACGPTAMLSHHSAATLWGLRPGRACPIHVTVAIGQHHRRPAGVIVHRSRLLEPRDIAIERGLPVTSPARTMLDIAATLPERDLGYILAEGLHKRLLTEGTLLEILPRSGRHTGRHALTQVIQRRTGSLTESQAQRRLLQLIRDAGLPPPETEVPLLDYRVDLLWRNIKLIVEVDGYQFHGTRASFERDRRRDARLTAAGFTVVRFAAPEIEHEPLAVVARLAQVIHALSDAGAM